MPSDAHRATSFFETQEALTRSEAREHLVQRALAGSEEGFDASLDDAAVGTSVVAPAAVDGARPGARVSGASG